MTTHHNVLCSYYKVLGTYNTGRAQNNVWLWLIFPPILVHGHINYDKFTE